MGLWVGTYAQKGGKGLYPLEPRGDALSVGAADERIRDASFGVWSPRYGMAYFVEEREVGKVRACRLTEAGWEEVKVLSSGGSLPCYLALSPDGQWLAVANYGDGAVGLLRLDRNTGVPLDIAGCFRPSGSGPDPARQDGPHAHCVRFEDGDALLHVDLGLDRVFRHELDSSGITASGIAFAAPNGSGPRHFLQHPDGTHALLLCELDARLLLLKREGAGFVCVDAAATAPPGAGSDNLGGHLGIDGEDVLVTNRGHDSLVRFALRDAKLRMSQWQHTGGSSPRHFVSAGETTLVAHEDGGGISSVRLGEGGRTDQVADLPGAAFIIEIPEPAGAAASP